MIAGNRAACVGVSLLLLSLTERARKARQQPQLLTPGVQCKRLLESEKFHYSLIKGAQASSCLVMKGSRHRSCS